MGSQAYGSRRPKVVELLGRGLYDSKVARIAGVSRQYVGEVRAQLGLSPSSESTPSNPGRRAASPALRELRIPDGQAEANVELNGGTLTVRPGSEGRVLLALREHATLTAVVRADRAHLDAVIATLTAARDALPEVEMGADLEGVRQCARVAP